MDNRAGVVPPARDVLTRLQIQGLHLPYRCIFFCTSLLFFCTLFNERTAEKYVARETLTAPVLVPFHRARALSCFVLFDKYLTRSTTVTLTNV